MAGKQFSQALALLKQANQADPQDALIWYGLGCCQAHLGQHAKAAASFGTSIALWPKFYGNYLQRGVAYLEMKDYDQARADFNEAIRRHPDDTLASTSPSPTTAAYLNRALARAGLQDYKGANADVTYVLEQSTDAPTRAYFMRAQFRARAGDAAGARADQAEGLRRRPTDCLSFVTRGVQRLADDPAGALADFDEALELDPHSLAALRNKAHVLSERLGRTTEALDVLTRALEIHPDNAPLLAGRGVLLARLHRRVEALRDAQHVLQVDHEPETLYQAACVYALTSKQQTTDRPEALRLLALALAAGYGHDFVRTDPDLDPLRRLPEFERLIGPGK
jgi:tetratricopeptide (TPR) repeat protein